jgi:phosphotriesterase-related protein
MTASVMTVLGPVPASELGVVTPHEHLLVTLYTWPEQRDNPRFGERVTLSNLGWVRQHWSMTADNTRLTSEALAIAELRRYKAAGGGTIVDLTQDGIGRSPGALVRISEASGVHIVMGSGAYIGPTHPEWVRTASVDELARAFVREARQGVKGRRGGGVRPGILGELGCSWPLEPAESRVLDAGARAQQETGLGISIHPGRDRSAPFEIVDRLEAAGADLSRVVIGHLDRTLQDLPGLIELGRRGVMLEFDLFGLETSYYPWSGVRAGLSDAQRLDLVRGLIDAGLGTRIVMAHDICTKHRLARYGGHGYDHIVSNVIPWMRTLGFTEPEIHDLTVANPARLLAGDA